MTLSNKGRIGPVQYRALLSSFLGWMFDGFETSTLILVGGAAVMSLLDHPGANQVRLTVGAALGSTLMGWAIGGLIGSILADYIGRKKMLLISIAGYCAFTAFTAASQTVSMLIVLRFLTGLFLGSEWSTGTALVAETWPSSARAKALGVMQAGYGFGFFLAAGLWLIIQPIAGPEGWRWMFVVGVLPALLLIYMRRDVAESQLWLDAVAHRPAVKGRPATMSGGSGRFTLFELFDDRQARNHALATLILAAITVSVFYAISALTGPFIAGIAGRQGYNPKTWASVSALVYNAGAITGYISAGFIADALGRKPYMYLTFTGSVLSGVAMYFAPQTLGFSLVCVAVLGCFTLGVFSWMPIYLPELFPTRLRATAAGFVFNLARLVAFPLPILTAFLFSRLGGYQPTVLCLTLFYLVSIAVLRLLPETKNSALPV